MDNYTGQPQQQQQQHEGSTSYLQHLSSLTLSGDKTSEAAMQDFSTLPQLQKLCLMETGAVTVTGGLACLSALQGLTSLTMSRINIGGRQPAEFSVLSSLTSLRHFAVSLPLPAWAALRLLGSLAHVPAIDVAVGSSRNYNRSSRGHQEVRLPCSVVVDDMLWQWQKMCFCWFSVSNCVVGMTTKPCTRGSSVFHQTRNMACRSFAWIKGVVEESSVTVPNIFPQGEAIDVCDTSALDHFMQVKARNPHQRNSFLRSINARNKGPQPAGWANRTIRLC